MISQFVLLATSCPELVAVEREFPKENMSVQLGGKLFEKGAHHSPLPAVSLPAQHLVENRGRPYSMIPGNRLRPYSMIPGNRLRPYPTIPGNRLRPYSILARVQSHPDRYEHNGHLLAHLPPRGPASRPQSGNASPGRPGARPSTRAPPGRSSRAVRSNPCSKLSIRSPASSRKCSAQAASNGSNARRCGSRMSLRRGRRRSTSARPATPSVLASPRTSWPRRSRGVVSPLDHRGARARWHEPPRRSPTSPVSPRRSSDRPCLPSRPSPPSQVTPFVLRPSSPNPPPGVRSRLALPCLARPRSVSSRGRASAPGPSPRRPEATPWRA